MFILICGLIGAAIVVIITNPIPALGLCATLFFAYEIMRLAGWMLSLIV